MENRPLQINLIWRLPSSVSLEVNLVSPPAASIASLVTFWDLLIALNNCTTIIDDFDDSTNLAYISL